MKRFVTRVPLLIAVVTVSAGEVVAYDPQSTSEANGKTIVELRDGDQKLVSYAAQMSTLLRWCNLSGGEHEEQIEELGVNPYDFKLRVQELAEETIEVAQSLAPRRRFCAENIYAIFAEGGELFGEGGIYDGREPWLKKLKLKDGMTADQLEAEIELTVAYYGAARCGWTLEYEKEEAFKVEHKLDDEWYGQFDQNNELLNETFLRLGPEDEMDCGTFTKKYRHLIVPSE